MGSPWDRSGDIKMLITHKTIVVSLPTEESSEQHHWRIPRAVLAEDTLISNVRLILH